VRKVKGNREELVCLMFDAWRMRLEVFIREIRGKVFWEGESVER
jgi:hypothetical protein